MGMYAVLAQYTLKLFVIAFLISIGISSAYIYLFSAYIHWHLRKDITRVNFNMNTQKTIY